MEQKKISYCPECGNNSIQADGKRYYCNECQFEFFFNVAAACAAIIVYQDCIIATVRKHNPAKGQLDLPGGFVDPYESVEQAICREVKEELNIELPELNYIGSSHNRYPYSGVQYHTLDAFFVAKIDSIEGIHIEDDISDYKLIPIDKLQTDAFPFESIRDGLKMFLNWHCTASKK